MSRGLSSTAASAGAGRLGQQRPLGVAQRARRITLFYWVARRMGRPPHDQQISEAMTAAGVWLRGEAGLQETLEQCGEDNVRGRVRVERPHAIGILRLETR